MASIKFDKQSIEWSLFNDFWKLFQKYGDPGKGDEYWESLTKELNEFSAKYGLFGRALANALRDELERRMKE